jgi:chemotaxis-related protein WspB
MLVLVFRSGGDLYGLGAKQVVEVVPRVALRPVPHAPAFVAGLLAYRGLAVPVVDFGHLLGSGPGPDRLGTRLVVTGVPGPAGGRALLGLIAEDVSHVMTVDSAQVVSPGLALDEAPYLGPVLRTGRGLVQLVEAGRLLPPRLMDALCGEAPEWR